MRKLTFAVLERLADGDFHSGQALAHGLQVSRGSIWNALNEARAAGLDIQSLHGRGYRLLDTLEWLDAEAISTAVRGAGLTVRVIDCCASTNAAMLLEAEAGAAGGTVLVAELQTQGRGRLGRPWHAGIAQALTFSVLWRFEGSIADLGGLSLAVGVGIARALRRDGVCVELKWPNDLLWQGRKLGGILIEVRGDALGPCTAVIGVGLNVRLGTRERQRIDQPAAALDEAGGAQRTRGEWLISVLQELAAVLRDFSARGFAAVREEWMSYHAHQGKTVSLIIPNGTILEGEALGVDDAARLLIATSEGTRAVYAGDVSLRASS